MLALPKVVRARDSDSGKYPILKRAERPSIAARPAGHERPAKERSASQDPHLPTRRQKLKAFFGSVDTYTGEDVFRPTKAIDPWSLLPSTPSFVQEVLASPPQPRSRTQLKLKPQLSRRQPSIRGSAHVSSQSLKATFGQSHRSKHHVSARRTKSRLCDLAA